MVYNYVWFAILNAKHVSIYQQLVKVVIPYNSDLLSAIYVLATMDIIIAVQKSVPNVKLTVKPVLIIILIANLVIH